MYVSSILKFAMCDFGLNDVLQISVLYTEMVEARQNLMYVLYYHSAGRIMLVGTKFCVSGQSAKMSNINTCKNSHFKVPIYTQSDCQMERHN